MDASTQKLVDALTEARVYLSIRASTGLDPIIERAREDFYHDYKGPNAFPLIQLVADLSAIHPREGAIRTIIERVKNGDFDGTKEEAEAWKASLEGRETMKEFGLE